MKFACGWFAASLLALPALLGNAAFAQQFSGRAITMIVNYSAGGPTDIEARLIARYLPKYLQGLGSVVVRNVGGAGGVIGVNQLGEASERDRLNVGYFTWNPVDQLIQDPVLHVRYNDLKFIAGFRSLTLVYMRRDTPPGISRSADVVKAPIIKAGALGHSSHGTLRQRLALDLLGAKHETIAGYKGLNEIELAVRRGDLNLTNTSLTLWYASVKPNMADTGIVMPLFQYDYERADGTLGRNPDLPDVPAFSEVFKEAMGPAAAPSGERWQALQLLTRIMDSMYRTAFMPPNAPAAAVEEMRGAFEKLLTDAEFVADFEKIVKTRPNFVIGSPGEAIISELVKVQPSFANFLRKYIDAARH
jgi:tripartite-type tricarboxylate transporter receptor subunit TctC